MLRRTLDIALNTRHKRQLKKRYYNFKKLLSDNLYSYGVEELKDKLTDLGIRTGDTLLVHSAFNVFNGFKGRAQDVINCLIGILGKNGNLLMVSLPYLSSSYDYLQTGEIFDVRKTPSRMGLISEIFRRKKGVLRSLHPTHPVLAYGKDAEWIVDGHEKCPYPCGKNTPFDKIKSLSGKTLFFDVPFNRFTFIHHIEDLIQDNLPFPLYTEEPIPAKTLDYDGNELTVNTYAFSDLAVKSRRPEILENYLFKNKMLQKARIGKTVLMLVAVEDAVRCSNQLADNHIFFYRA
jgi:aminoglycoside 3-N-acetyltransferase